MLSKINIVKKQLNNLINKIDNEITIRCRKLKFRDVFYAALYAAGNNKSLDQTKAYLKFENIANVSSAAINKKRKKIPAKYFQKINDTLIDIIYKNTKEQRLIAVDSSQINLSIELSKEGFDLSNNKKYAVGYLGSLYDINKGLPINDTLYTKRDERAMVKDQLKYLKKGDILIMDRGYYGHEFAKWIDKNKIKYIFRLPNNRLVTRLNEANVNDLIITDGDLKIRVLKYNIDGCEYYIGTNLYYKFYKEFKDLYWKRWNVETYFRYGKYDLGLMNIKSKSTNKVNQDIACNQFIFIIESIIRDIANQFIDSKNYKINTKHCLDIVRTKIIYLLLYKRSTKKLIDVFNKCIESVYTTLVKIIENRNYNRIRIKPATRWCNRGSRYGGG
jgi:hypothetical protein